MLKFIRGRGKDRSRHLKDLFSIQKTSLHGFPHHPTAFAYDPSLGLIAIASKRSSLRVYGKPGVEFCAELDADLEVRQIKFVPGSRGQLVLLAEDGTIQLWELNGSSLDRRRSSDYFAKEKSAGTLKSPTTFEICLKSSSLESSTLESSIVLVGTQSGNIHSLNLDTLELLEQVIYQDVVLQNVPAEQKKSSQGSVEVIAQGPSDGILIGYQRGLIALWKNSSLSAERYYGASQQLESLSWTLDGDGFVTSHNDGSIINWKISDDLNPSEDPRIPYGPFPCKPVTKVAVRNVNNNQQQSVKNNQQQSVKNNNQQQLLVFSGGMPRASYGDKFTVTICEGDFESGKHHVLDFTSKVVDFEIIDDPLVQGSSEAVQGSPEAVQGSSRTVHRSPKAVLVLLEEEIVAIDLTSPEWLQLKLPYLSSIHSSGITSCTHYSDIPDDIFKSILDAGTRHNSGKYSSNPWPILGGAVGEEASTVKTNDLLVTGHEDGSVSLWNASHLPLGLILSLQTRKFFMATDSDITPIDGEDEPQEEDPSNEWPPFRKAGTFDPYSDDVRLAIRNVVFCPKSGTFVAAGTAGQIVSFHLSLEPEEKKIPTMTWNIVDDSTGFIWKGHDQLHLKNGSLKFDPGLIPHLVLQLSPPAAITALTFNSDWNLLSAGTAHGFLLLDTLTNKVLLTKCTLSPADLAATAEGNLLITRRKSFKKSLRESFRRLRKGRTSLRKKSPASTPAKTGESSDGAGPSTPAKDTPSGSKVTSPIRSFVRGPVTFDDESPRLERQIEAKTDDGLGSMVRTIYMAPANVTNANVLGPTLWVGTNAGTVYIHTITLPEKEKRTEEEVSAQLAKEIQLKHRAPVIYVQVIDSTGSPVPSSLPPPSVVEEAPATVEGEAAVDATPPVAPPPAVTASPSKSGSKVPAASYRVLIVSEEQFKLFQLPSLKPDRKSKLTAHEGSRARKVNISSFLPKTGSENVNSSSFLPKTGSENVNSSSLLPKTGNENQHVEHCLCCLSNQGDVSIYDLTDLKRQTSCNLIKKEDAHGIASLLFTDSSEGLYLHSPSEFQRFSLSTRRVLLPNGIVEIPEGVRPVVVEPVVVEPVAVEPTVVEPAVIPEPGAAAVVASAVEEEGKKVEERVKEDDPVLEESPIVEAESVAAAVAEAALAVTELAVTELAVTDLAVTEEALPGAERGISGSVTVGEVLPSPVIESTEPDEGERNFESILHQELIGLADPGSDLPTLIPQQDIVDQALPPTNGHHNGVNRDSGVNGDTGVNRDSGVNGDNGVNGDAGDGLIEQLNGTNGASSPLNDTDISYATNDITIDSVRDFTNLTLSESPSATADKVPKKVVTPTPSSALNDANVNATIGD